MNVIYRQQDYSDPTSLASKFRMARSKYVRDLIESIFKSKGSCRIIDIGGRPQYWSLFDRHFLDHHNVKITIVNIEEQNAVDDDMFTQLQGRTELLDIADNSFDLAHSNSVIEHVGSWTEMETFSAEVRRTAPCYYVQTPYFWFPVEPHFSSLFFHWLPEAVRARRLMKRAHGFHAKASTINDAMRSVQQARLLDRAMMNALFPDAAHVDEKFVGLTKSLMAIKGLPTPDR